jgi:hypothetical protein
MWTSRGLRLCFLAYLMRLLKMAVISLTTRLRA